MLWNPGSLLPLFWPDLYVCFPLVQTLSHPPRSWKHLQQYYRAALRGGPAFSIMVFPGVLLFLRDERRWARLLHTPWRWAGTSADKPSVCATWKIDEGVKKSPDNFIKWPQFCGKRLASGCLYHVHWVNTNSKCYKWPSQQMQSFQDVTQDFLQKHCCGRLLENYIKAF